MAFWIKFHYTLSILCNIAAFFGLVYTGSFVPLFFLMLMGVANYAVARDLEKKLREKAVNEWKRG